MRSNKSGSHVIYYPGQDIFESGRNLLIIILRRSLEKVPGTPGSVTISTKKENWDLNTSVTILFQRFLSADMVIICVNIAIYINDCLS